MQQPQPQPSKPRPRGRKPSLLMLTGIGVGLVLLVLLVVLAWTKGGGNEPKSAGPGVFIDEDFRSAVANGRLLPDGWEGDAFRVAKDNDACCLESTKPSGLQTVLTKLSDALRGNFFIEGIYHLDNPHQFTITLENRSRSSALAVVFNWDGKVAIDNDPRLAPTNYIPLKPTHFLIRREGKMLRVYLDKVQALQKSLDDAPDFDTLRLGLTAGNGWHQRLARLYLLKAGTTGDEGAASAPTPPPKDKANKKR